MTQKLFRVGERVEGFDYPVVDEREVRGGAGLMLLVGVFALFMVKVYGFYFMIQYTVALFFLEFLLKTAIGPHASIFGFISKFILRKHDPEWIGAIQKKFAWSLGLIMSASMVIIVGLYQIKGVLPTTICLICLSLMWLESVFGICVGCKIYWGLIDLGILKTPKVAPKCPGGVCKMS